MHTARSSISAAASREAPSPVLILGGGINGASVARELVLNGVPVWLVDRHDLAAGATSRSSRLIHGGLRYLEYGDFGLVRESLEERNRLRRLAPQFVRPLRLYIPIARRTGGLLQSALRFLGIARSRSMSWLAGRVRSERGLWTVRLGLTVYDWLARSDEFPSHRVSDPTEHNAPTVDSGRFRWLCAYSDAQMLYPERFVIALLEDARHTAARNGVEFQVFTHSRVALEGDAVRLLAEAENGIALRPSLIINATGAWGDRTLEGLKVPARPLFGGTKGSHFLTSNRKLREALGESGVYAEAGDGRLMFVLPFGDSVLVGTTDERFDACPGTAVATPRELEYLLSTCNELFPDVGLVEADIDLHYSGIRPLPAAPVDRTAAISRDHWIEEHSAGTIPVFTLVGGKLTTCRAFAEDVTNRVLSHLGRPRTADTRERVVPGGEHYPSSDESLREAHERLSAAFGLELRQVEALWRLYGTRTERVLQELSPLSGAMLVGTEFPIELVRWIITHEWATQIEDLVERRLMLLYQPQLSEQTLRQLAECLVEAGRLPAHRVEDEVARCRDRLATVYGKRVAPAGQPAAVRN